jgi:hypothetical protein
MKRNKVNVKQQEAAIKDIIKKYGPVIDLQKAPFLIVEIVQQFGSVLGLDPGTVASGTPGSHGTPPPPPPPGPGDMLDFHGLLLEIRSEVQSIKKALRKIGEKMGH